MYVCQRDLGARRFVFLRSKKKGKKRGKKRDQGARRFRFLRSESRWTLRVAAFKKKRKRKKRERKNEIAEIREALDGEE
jgi:hypothetical protein